MKLILLLTIIAFSYGEKLDRNYLPPDGQASGGSNEILQPPITRPIVVADNEDFRREVEGTVIHEEEIQRPNVVEVERPIVTNVVADSAALQRPIGFVVNANNQAIDDVVRIGNRNNIFVHNQKPVEYKEIHYQEPRYHVVEQRPERTQTAHERNAAVLRQEYKNEGDAYAYAYETENGIWAEENGVAKNGVNAQGAYSYIGDDGVQYSMSYTADENGFQPQGDHIPTPHPIPEEILRSIEQNARDEAAGIYDDGSYDELKYGELISGNQHIVNVVQNLQNHYNVPTNIQHHPTEPTIIQNHPTVPTIIQNHPTVPTIIDQSEGPAITNPLLFKYRTPGYRYPSILVNQKNTLAPVVNTLIPEVTPSTVNKEYLPPVKRKIQIESRPLKKRKTVVVIRNRKPEYKKNRNDKS